MDKEIKLILTKLKLVSEIEESGAYICDKEHSKLLLDYITNLQDYKSRNEKAIEYIRNTKYCEWRTERGERGNLNYEKVETTLVSGLKLLDILEGSE